MVADYHLQQSRQLCQKLMYKLYRRNPKQLQRGRAPSIEERYKQLFSQNHNWQFEELHGKTQTKALQLALDKEFTGDRVMALTVGIGSMLATAYGKRNEHFLLSRLRPQALYNFARNLEILSWRLRHTPPPPASPLLLTNSLAGETPRNCSFARLFGRLIQLQDSLAHIAAQQQQRLLNEVVQTAAQSTFIPLGAP